MTIIRMRKHLESRDPIVLHRTSKRLREETEKNRVMFESHMALADSKTLLQSIRALDPADYSEVSQGLLVEAEQMAIESMNRLYACRYMVQPTKKFAAAILAEYLSLKTSPESDQVGALKFFRGVIVQTFSGSSYATVAIRKIDKLLKQMEAQA